MLEPLGVDLVELSGGSYESPAMTGRPADERTRAREADRPMCPVTWSDKALASAAGMAQVRHRMRRLARGRATRHPPGDRPDLRPAQAAKGPAHLPDLAGEPRRTA
ncbi:hypothetical protein [Streptomyces filamentosus]|uniref:hypothetical protein n=1 Tax=Streptomyces filamentosus TaxID=67294 RepID=UPI0033CD7630